MKLIRVKKEIDLKELEKYGFSPCGRKDRPNYVKEIRDNRLNRMRIYVRSYCNQIEFQIVGIPHCYLDNTLYEMFKDGIIEEFDPLKELQQKIILGIWYNEKKERKRNEI